MWLALLAFALGMAAVGREARRDGTSGRFYEINGERFPSVTTILGIKAKPALVAWAANQERALCAEVATNLHGEMAGKVLDPAVFRAMFEARLGKLRGYKRTMGNAAEIGTQVHAAIEWQLRSWLDGGANYGPAPKLTTPEARTAFEWFLSWAESVELEPLYIEQVVWCRHVSGRFLYAGTLDLYARVRGREALIDFKTGKAVYSEALIQNAAYAYAMRSPTKAPEGARTFEDGLEGMGLGDPVCGLIVRLPKNAEDPGPEVVEVPDWDPLFAEFRSLAFAWRAEFEREELRRAAWAEAETKAAIAAESEGAIVSPARRAEARKAASPAAPAARKTRSRRVSAS